MRLLAVNHRRRADDRREKARLGTKMAVRLEVLLLTKNDLLYIHVTLMVPIIRAWFVISIYLRSSKQKGKIGQS